MLQLQLLDELSLTSASTKLALCSFKATIRLGLPTEVRHAQLNRLLLAHEQDLIHLLEELRNHRDR